MNGKPTRNKILRVASAYALPAFLLSFCLYHYEIFFDATRILPRDNHDQHLPMFTYLVNYLRNFGHFPRWLFSRGGGVWIEPLANNYLFLLPYRWVSYFVAAFSGYSFNGVYKFSLVILGEGVFLFGIFGLAKELLKSKVWSRWLVLTAALTSVCIVPLHAEQALGTTFYIPFLWWSFLKLGEDFSKLPVFAALLGLSLNNHYPQILMIYGVAVLICGVCLSADARVYISKIFRRLGDAEGALMGVIALTAFIISASPLIYSYSTFRGKLSSPHRHQGGGIVAENYSEYLEMNQLEKSSLRPARLASYLGFSIGGESLARLDENVLFVTPAVLLALVLVILASFPGSVFHMAMVTVLAILSMGIHGPAPRLLWGWFPGINLFRQWYFFAPVLNLHLLLLVFLTIKHFCDRQILKRTLGFGVTICGLCLLPVLPPLYSAPPLVLGVLMFFDWKSERTRRRVFMTLTLGWLFVGSLWWSQGALDRIQQAMQTAPAKFPKSHDDFARQLAWNPSEDFPYPLIAPRGIPVEQWLENASFGQVFWRGAGNRFFPVRRREVSVAIERGRLIFQPLQIPAGVNHFLFLQFNDGGWESSRPIDGSKQWIEISARDLAGFSLQRRSSPWSYLIVLCWLPLLVAMLMSYKSQRAVQLAPRVI